MGPHSFPENTVHDRSRPFKLLYFLESDSRGRFFFLAQKGAIIEGKVIISNIAHWK